MRLLGLCGQAGSGKNAAAASLEAQGFRSFAFADPVKTFAHDVFGFSAEQLWGPSPFRNEDDVSFATRERWNQAEDTLAVEGLSYLREYFPQLPPRAMFSLYNWFIQFQRDHMTLGQGLSPRTVLQSFGTSWGRGYDEDIWVNICMTLVLGQRFVAGCTESDYGPIQPTVITDVRFENEMKAIRDVGGKIIRIERPGFDEKALDLGLGSHQSETEQAGVIGEYANAVILNSGTLDHFHDQLSSVVGLLFGDIK